MNLTIENLRECFNAAKDARFKYVGVKIKMQGFEKPEIIINETANFDSKLAYYTKAYNKDLTLKAFNGIKIIGFTFGTCFQEIEADLVK